MPTTTNIGLSTPPHGANVDTWDADPINNNSGILDAVFGSVTTKSLTNADVTLSTTESQVSVLRFTGTLSGNVVITLGAVIKSWICENNTVGAFNLQVRGSTIGPTFVGLPPGSSQIYWDGTSINFVNLGRVGEWWDYPGTAVPAWVTACSTPPYLHANGGTFSAVTYPQLNQILGGTTLPDTRGRSRFALNGGTARLTTAGGIDGDTRFAVGGDGDGLVLGTANLPPYTPAGTNSAPTITIGGGTIGGTSNAANPPAGGNSPSIGATITATSSAPAFTGAAQGGTSTPIASVPPGIVGGIMMLRAA